jgi:hypothetical protein
MQERRKNYKQVMKDSKAAKTQNERSKELFDQLDEIRGKIRGCGIDYDLYCKYKQQEMEIIARIATF